MLTNISSVTETLKKLIKNGLIFNGEPQSQFSVSAAPPDANFGTLSTRFISVYLFHVLESPEFKNYPPIGGTSRVPVQQAPLGMILQYIITVVSPQPDDGIDTEATTQQRLLGSIARILHDYPAVTDKTQIDIGGTDSPFILDPELRGNDAALHFILRPAPMEETINFWSAQDVSVPRLSLFVEARVVILEPKPPEIAPGIVLSVGQFLFTSGEAQLVRSRSTLSFVPPSPPVPGPPQARSVVTSPARVAVFDASGSDTLTELVNRPGVLDVDKLLENNRVTFEASGLGPGKRTLVLENPSRSLRIALDDVAAANVDWQIAMTAAGVSLRVFEQVTDVEGAVRTVLPGLYTARVIILDDRLGDAARPRSSNEVAVSIVPQVLSVVATSTADVYDLTLVTESLTTSSKIELSVGGRALAKTTGTSPGVGQYVVIFGDPLGTPPTRTVIRFGLPYDDPSAVPPVVLEPTTEQPLAIRLLVDGATATPEWVVAP